MNVRKLVLLATLAALLAAPGCRSSPPEGTVSGKASVKGQPLTAGIICFIDPSQGTGASAPLGPGGEFSVEAPVRTGTYNVYWSMPFEKIRMPGDPPPPTPPANAPKRDVNEQASKVRVEVRPGPNTFNLDLE